MTVTTQGERPEGQTAVRRHAIDLLTSRGLPAPDDRQLRRWMTEGTVPNINRLSDVTDGWLTHVSETLSLIGRGKFPAPVVRVALAVRGFPIAHDVLAADLPRAMAHFFERLPDRSPDESVEDKFYDDTLTRMIDDLSEHRYPESSATVRTLVQAARRADDPRMPADERVDSVIGNLLSMARGDGIYDPGTLIAAFRVCLEDMGVKLDPEYEERARVALERAFNLDPEQAEPVAFDPLKVTDDDRDYLAAIEAQAITDLEKSWNQLVWDRFNALLSRPDGIRTVIAGAKEARTTVDVVISLKAMNPGVELSHPRFDMACIVVTLFNLAAS